MVTTISLGYDIAESDIMKERPRDLKESILANYTWSRVLIRGTIMGLMVFLGFLLAAISSFLVTIISFFNVVMGTAPLSLQIYLMVIFIPALPTLILSGLKELFNIRIW